MVSPIPSLGRTPARVATRRTVFDPERNDIVDNDNDNGIVDNENRIVDNENRIVDNDNDGIPGAAIRCLFQSLSSCCHSESLRILLNPRKQKRNIISKSILFVDLVLVSQWISDCSYFILNQLALIFVTMIFFSKNDLGLWCF